MADITIKAGKFGANPADLPSTAVVSTINASCANPKAVWASEMNSTTWPTDEQLAKLMKASQVCVEELPIIWAAGVGQLTLTLAPYAAVSVAV